MHIINWGLIPILKPDEDPAPIRQVVEDLVNLCPSCQSFYMNSGYLPVNCRICGANRAPITRTLEALADWKRP